MYQEELEKMIDVWEPTGCEVVRVIDSYDDTVERVVKFASHNANGIFSGMQYSLFRYFTLGDRPNVHVSVDLQEVDADRVIQHLAERL